MKELAAAALAVDNEAFVVHIASILEATSIHPSRQAQIASLNAKEVTIPAEYSDYTEVFFSETAAELPEHTGINDHPIDLVAPIFLSAERTSSLRYVSSEICSGRRPYSENQGGDA